MVYFSKNKCINNTIQDSFKALQASKFLFLIPLTTLIILNSKPMKAQTNNRYFESSKIIDGKFQNQQETHMMTGDESMLKIMRKWIKGTPNGTPKLPIKTMPLQQDFFSKDRETLAYTWFGHSTILMNFHGVLVLTDPVFSKNASPVPYSNKSFEYTENYNVAQLPNIDIVLISHDHYDHLDKKTIKQLHKKTNRFYVPLKVKKRLIKWGIDKNKISEANWWDTINDPSGLVFTATPARHFSGRGITNRNTTLWCSWAITHKNVRLFFGGDSGYGEHFKAIGEKLGPFDLTFMECGQYNENWRNIHCLPEESVQAAIDLQGKSMVPIHWGKFKLSLHSWTEPIERAKKEAENKNLPFSAPIIGNSNKIEVPVLKLSQIEN
jgi:L-ascorbate metabolism protein UlaG (beta-lactamase superfamily)